MCVLLELEFISDAIKVTVLSLIVLGAIWASGIVFINVWEKRSGP